MNYLHPNEPEREDTLEEHVHCNRLFVRALSFLLKKQGTKEEGIVVDMDNKRYVVHTSEDKISISDFEINTVPEGTLVWLHDNIDETFEFSDEYLGFCKENNLDIHDGASIDTYVNITKAIMNIPDGASMEQIEQHIYNSIYKETSEQK